MDTLHVQEPTVSLTMSLTCGAPGANARKQGQYDEGSHNGIHFKATWAPRLAPYAVMHRSHDLSVGMCRGNPRGIFSIPLSGGTLVSLELLSVTVPALAQSAKHKFFPPPRLYANYVAARLFNEVLLDEVRHYARLHVENGCSNSVWNSCFSL